MEVNVEQAREILGNTPSVLNHLLKGLSEPWAQGNEGGDSWSPYDIIGHLIHGEKTDWIPRMKIILEYGEARVFEPFDRFAQFKDSKGKTLSDLLDTFGMLRKQNLEALAELNITPEKLTFRGAHPELGLVTLGQLLATWVAHDLGHIVQASRTMAKQYKDQVGPWEAYLRILND
jgi:hypothetical protein